MPAAKSTARNQSARGNGSVASPTAWHRPDSKVSEVRSRLLDGEELSIADVKSTYATHKSFMGYVVKQMRAEGIEVAETVGANGRKSYRIPTAQPRESGDAEPRGMDALHARLESGAWVAGRDLPALGLKPQALSAAMMRLRKDGRVFETRSERINRQRVHFHRLLPEGTPLPPTVVPAKTPARRVEMGSPPQPSLGDSVTVTMLAQEPDGTVAWRVTSGCHHWLVEMRGYTRA